MVAGRVVELGTGSETVVWLHSSAGVGEDDAVLGALADRYRVIAPVFPGFDDLAELDDIRDVHDLALHYDDLFDELGLDGATVVGHSLGGMVAAELAAHVPHRVARLVLIAPVGLWNDDEPMADLFTAFPAGVGELLYAEPPAMTDVSIDSIISLLQGLTATGKFIWPLPDKGLARRLRRIGARTLVVWGSADRLVPASYADAFAHGIAGARVEIVDGGAHMVPYERTDEVLALIDKFLTEE